MLAVESHQNQITAIDPNDYLYLVEIVAHKFRKKRVFEKIQDTDAYSIASIELVKAAKAFNPNINKDFSKYAYRAMCNGVIQNIRYQKAKKRTVKHVDITDQEWTQVKDKCFESLEQDSKKLLLKLFVESPDDNEQDRLDKDLLIDIYIHHKKVPAIAEQEGVSRVAIYNRIKRIIGKIRQQHRELVEDEIKNLY